jgi:diadenosine tetraphosphate (Ap4A) HIT family hydrolase
MIFQLHPRLRQDCIELGHFKLCRLLLLNDSQFPWFLLVPERPNLTEQYQLNKSDRIQLIDESCYLSENLATLFNADKINIGAIGNIVPQLHIHHIVRYHSDPAWPEPVWGKFDLVKYPQEKIQQITQLLSPIINNYE